MYERLTGIFVFWMAAFVVAYPIAQIAIDLLIRTSIRTGLEYMLSGL